MSSSTWLAGGRTCAKGFGTGAAQVQTIRSRSSYSRRTPKIYQKINRQSRAPVRAAEDQGVNQLERVREGLRRRSYGSLSLRGEVRQVVGLCQLLVQRPQFIDRWETKSRNIFINMIAALMRPTLNAATKSLRAKVKTLLRFATVRLKSKTGNWLYGLMEALMASVRLIPAIAPHGNNPHCLSSLSIVALVGEKESKAVESVRSLAVSPYRDRVPKQPAASHSVSVGHKGKNWQICKRAVLARILATTVGLTFAYGAQTADAQTTPLPQAEAQQPAVHSASVPAGYCKQSTLTGPAFLNLLNTIVKHGDLTDIAFLQKTLGTKFSMSYGLWYGKPDHQEQEYDSDEVLGSPIHVHVVVNLDVIEGRPLPLSNVIGTIRFEGVGSFAALGWGYLNDCMELPVKQLKSRYGAEGFRQIYASPPGNGPLGESTRAEFPGKHNTMLWIAWRYSPVGRIGIVSIGQQK